MRAGLAQRTEQRVGVGVADLTEVGMLGRRDQLVAGRQHHDARPGVHERRRVPGVRQQPQLGRARAACRPRRARCPPSRPRPRARTCRPSARGLEELHGLVVHPAVLDRNDAVGARGDRARRSRSAPPRRRPRSPRADARSSRGPRPSARRDAPARRRRRRPPAPRTRPCRWRRTPAARSVATMSSAATQP